MAWPGVLKVAFVLTLLALFFITVGYLLPWWFVGTNYYLGVFYGLVCNPGDISSGNCTVFSYYDLQRENADAAAIIVNNFFLIIQVITSVVVGLTLFASLILIVGACGNVKSKCPYVLAAIFQFFGALVAGLTAGAFAYVYVVIVVVSESHKAIDGYGNSAYTSDSRRNDYVVPGNAQKYSYDSRNEYSSNSKNDYSKSRNDYSGSRNDYSGSRNDYSGSKNGYQSKQDYPYRNDNMYRPYNNSGSRY
uniref:Uncharacterized protein n=1 Tax=Magallana gigas TaxID=29159 RepID=A0A8W8N0D2_MAGGI